MKSKFPVVILVDGCELQGEQRLLFIETPEQLPIGEKMVIFATNATPEMLDAIKRAWNTGYKEGRDIARASMVDDNR